MNTIGKKFRQRAWETGGYRCLTRLANALCMSNTKTFHGIFIHGIFILKRSPKQYLEQQGYYTKLDLLQITKP